MLFQAPTFLVTVTLALSLASASPFTYPKREIATAGTAIPIRKRSALADSNGVFNKDKAIIQIVQTQNKHRQNLLNLKSNLGKFTKGQKIKPLALLPARILSLLHIGKRQSGAEPLTDIQDDLEWIGTASIGTPEQTFAIDFDRSADLWVPSSECTSDTCDGKSKYSSSNSSTASKQDGNFTIGYGDGSSVTGNIYQDTVNVAGIAVSNQSFSPVTTLSASFKGDPIDGILGLAYPLISNLNSSPFFNSAFDQKVVSTNEFGFYLAANGSELFLGGTNSDLYTGELEYHDVSTSTGFWQISGASLLVDSNATVTGFDTIIDSGTTIMYGPPSDVKAFFDQIPGSDIYDETNGLYSYPCNSTSVVAFSWGGQEWSISADDFNLGATAQGSSDCVGSLAGQDLGLGDDVWLLGDSFMKNVYTAFSFEKDAVGFAALA
ncbi:acid protease [Mycena floridula]|nr:acid protease [Mycena floridula]